MPPCCCWENVVPIPEDGIPLNPRNAENKQDAENNQEEGKNGDSEAQGKPKEQKRQKHFPNIARRVGLFLWMSWSLVDALSLCPFSLKTVGILQMIGESSFGYFAGAILCFVSSPVPVCDVRHEEFENPSGCFLCLKTLAQCFGSLSRGIRNFLLLLWTLFN
eukprot:TRINITY_DN23685_c1_g1_i2.p1 TRINITY_DN23685_c1_g1~~TRINITY_DN23685_c1_g1_i2.p1  ORF type:complete len:162 (+),score=35.68 TRINITY_DN23685_c1_g1_i2:108-593(+)